MSIDKAKPDFIFESSWEVCNKVGGIHTVLSTRAKTLQTLFKDKIIFIGPDLWIGKDNPEFVENKTLLKSWRQHAEKNENLNVRVGRWNVPGKPIVILVDFSPYFECKNELYFQMWNKFKVDSMHAYGDYDESCIFAYAVGLTLKSYYLFHQLENNKVVAHFNEWMLAMGALYIKNQLPSVATVFTTHATSIGRSIAGNNKPLYAYLNEYNGDQMARELNMEAKHSVEKQAAWHVDCFTTVSDITAIECKQLLNKEPDIVTPNGFEDNFVHQGAVYDKKRKLARETLINVAKQLTGSPVSEDALLISTSGRYEYKNKGIDVFIEAINRLRIDKNIQKEIVAFILVPAWIKEPRKDLQNRLKEKSFKTKALPNPFITHELFDSHNDKVLNYLHYLQLLNQKNSKVKIIFVPSYLHGNDGIFNISYYDLLVGMDLTVFPSYYEPWGYTPLESIAFNIPTITTNLAGFGLWARHEEGISGGIMQGVEVIDRTDYNYFDVAEKIKSVIADYTLKSQDEIIQARNAAGTSSGKASWAEFIEYYLSAYDIALKKIKHINIKE